MGIYSLHIYVLYMCVYDIFYCYIYVHVILYVALFTNLACWRPFDPVVKFSSGVLKLIYSMVNFHDWRGIVIF